MARLPILNTETAPEAARDGVAKAEKANGFIPNLIGLLANAPVALETYQTVSGINARSDLSLAEREAVQITAATTHGCGFCVAGHTAIAYKKAGLTEDIVDALRANARVPDARLDAVAVFTRAVIRSRGAVADAELAAFKAAGFSDASALEVVLGVSLATLCNFANNLGKPELNPQLQPYAWTAPAVAVAAE
ncbi:MAG: carboxymuconolactone decarboxylase family protein [Xanthobacteraceae bacterium]|nr:carboxymuconolactone decarboxylase family protein [Xanthobacteraceae bacterium]